MIPFSQLCPQLARHELRSIIVEAAPPIPADRYALVEYYCDKPNCDCRRVILKVISQARGNEEATVSYGFDASDPMRGPFLDPLHKQRKYAKHILELVAELLTQDPDYVRRLERHYQIAKAVSLGTLLPHEAQASPRLSGVVLWDQLCVSGGHEPTNTANGNRSASRLPRKIDDVNPDDSFEQFVRMGEACGFDMTTVEGRAGFAEVIYGVPDVRGTDLPGTASRRPFFGPGSTTSRQTEKAAKKRDRQNKKRNRR